MPRGTLLINAALLLRRRSQHIMQQLQEAARLHGDTSRVAPRRSAINKGRVDAA